MENNDYGRGNYLGKYLYAIILLCIAEHEECMKFMDRHERQTDMSEADRWWIRLSIAYVISLY